MRTIAVLLAAGVCGPALAQVPERTIEEIKVEAQARAERGSYPLGGLNPADVREALAAIKSRDRDEWAAAWSAVAARYTAAAAAAPTPKDASENYLKAWRLYYFAQWPVPSSPGKQQAYKNALDAFARRAQALDPPLEVVRIPFEGSEIVGYLRLPKGAQGPVPLVLAISGLDSRKETMSETYNAILAHGIGFFAVDGPGTGQAPIKVSETADRVFSRVLDYLGSRPEIDKSRIVVHGVSFGGYWSTKLAVNEKNRIRGAVAQSPPVHEFFQESFLRNGVLGNREYLFDLAPAFTAVFEGAEKVEDLSRIFPRMSLVTQGIIGKPTAPMLIVTGVKDTQVPWSDAELLLRTGDAPKMAWINPVGGHLGREPRGWIDPVIFSRVILPWEVMTLTAP
jgi:pimeloyl-ACP methyl ester carboxylesterase